MKAWVWFWLISTILLGQGACAPGSSQSGASYEAPAPNFVPMTFQNPETPEERDMRIWREEMGR
jgi:hypothetical protein